MDGQPDDLNQWLATNRVVAVTQHLVATPAAQLLVFVVESVGAAATPQPSSEPRIDYKQALSPEDFEKYSRLRALRKTVAEQEGVPLYSIFTNAQLAEIVERRIDSLQALVQIEGIGRVRGERYAQLFLSALHETDAAKGQVG